ncbi:hypothetical protein [Candidatus Chloroploca asiatica]|uniref:Uncharacterized protein n=1 Tax=Candidatus Chloroploca asiatica TaxID=1506545 RepID=A0A2H3KRS2_9CHLR|nr:hypothetical protein [Candidatus Chloroploca asiatica]PDW01246.1 hypothetical protein A9Q02_07360 [Candidatus Chloroploca asiatica]
MTDGSAVLGETELPAFAQAVEGDGLLTWIAVVALVLLAFGGVILWVVWFAMAPSIQLTDPTWFFLCS